MQIKPGDIVEIWGEKHKIKRAVFPYFWGGQWRLTPPPLNFPTRADDISLLREELSAPRRFVRARFCVTEVGFDNGKISKIKGVAVQNMPDKVDLTPYIDDMRVVPPGEDFIDITPDELRNF